ncbi:MAG: hypothetical protein SGJ27_31215 [Candidatus Melainabacteria bacterium]|mgnify:CR=1 FL=1|nr:hypothetical protein [Candidatus Melainabacteria bacterium]
MKWLDTLRQKPGDDNQERGFIRIPEDKDDSLKAGESPTKQEVIDSACYYTCTRMCYGVKDQAGGCCMIGDRDFIIGPISDTARFIEDLSKKLGEKIKFEDVFIEYDEGHKMFPDKSCWQNPKNFPAMRVLPDESRGFPCQMLSLDSKCMVHSIKPEVCNTYLCDYLKGVVGYLEDKL